MHPDVVEQTAAAISNFNEHLLFVFQTCKELPQAPPRRDDVNA